MKIVIDIDGNVLTRLFDNGIEDYQIVNDDLFAIAKAIRGGTPLPKGHGRLIDADELFKEVGNIRPQNIVQYKEIGRFLDMITCSPTIIGADKGDI